MRVKRDMVDNPRGKHITARAIEYAKPHGRADEPSRVTTVSEVKPPPIAPYYRFLYDNETT